MRDLSTTPQPHFVIDKVKKALGNLKDKKIAALGLAYKPEVDDLRESPATEVVHLLQKEGAQVKAWEPFKPDANLDGIDMAVSLNVAIEDADLILLLVKHTEFAAFKAEEIARRTKARIAVDSVNGWKMAEWQKAGFQFHRLGDNKSQIKSQKS